MKFNNYLSEKDQPDFTGTGIKPEDGWKTPEQLEQDKAQSDVDSKTQKENQKEKIYNDELDRLKKRDDLIHTKLGRILATPEELEELGKVGKDDVEKLGKLLLEYITPIGESKPFAEIQKKMLPPHVVKFNKMVMEEIGGIKE